MKIYSSSYLAWMVALLMLVEFGARAQENRPGVLRTPDERFANLPEFPFQPHYKDIAGYRMHYLDEGPPKGEVILLLHGEPTWCYLYRKMIPVLTQAGFRCIVPDLIGFGRSDKPVQKATHTYKFHVDAVTALVKALKLKNVTFFGQDWGGLIGLRVVAENEALFARVVISNTGLPTGDGPISPGFMAWKKMNQSMIERGDMNVGELVAGSIGAPELAVAYDAPFPDKRFKAGPLIMPQLVPASPDDPARAANLKAWETFRQWKKPFLTAFGNRDPITGGGDKKFQSEVPGAKGQPHTTVEGGKHFIQETNGKELAEIIVNFIKKTRKQ
ncbi:MAG TPA: haloalkane dehalogenase [Blastocatellia bacterium]|nr:haloalkane dehalogenase [Blastocatellia bacterium]